MNTPHVQKNLCTFALIAKVLEKISEFLKFPYLGNLVYFCVCVSLSKETVILKKAIT